MQGFAKSNTVCKCYDGSALMMEQQNVESGADYVL